MERDSMEQDNFSYASTAGFGASSSQLRVHVYCEEALRRAEMAEDLRSAGYQIGIEADVDNLFDQRAEELSDLIVLDCTGVNTAQLAGLARLDMLLVGSSVELLVSTSLENLDEVFACFHQTNPQILVEPSRAERMVATARYASQSAGSSMREMSEEERVRLSRLSEQVEALAQRMDRGNEGYRSGSAYFASAEANRGDTAHIQPSPSDTEITLPSPRFIRQIIRQRQARGRFFDPHLFGDPAWDMLLDLSAAHGERHPVSVTSLCIASGVPATTALRWVKQMVEMDLFERTQDSSDKRRAFIGLSDKAINAMARYFAEFRAEETAV
jgi:DNA-binding MarR family transcriptional regulator